MGEKTKKPVGLTGVDTKINSILYKRRKTLVLYICDANASLRNEMTLLHLIRLNVYEARLSPYEAALSCHEALLTEHEAKPCQASCFFAPFGAKKWLQHL